MRAALSALSVRELKTAFFMATRFQQVQWPGVALRLIPVVVLPKLLARVVQRALIAKTRTLGGVTVSECQWGLWRRSELETMNEGQKN